MVVKIQAGFFVFDYCNVKHEFSVVICEYPESEQQLNTDYLPPDCCRITYDTNSHSE